MITKQLDTSAIEAVAQAYADGVLRGEHAHAQLATQGLFADEIAYLLDVPHTDEHTDAFDPNQPRDKSGRWASGSGVGGSVSGGSKAPADRSPEGKRRRALQQIKARLAKKSEAKTARAAVKAAPKKSEAYKQGYERAAAQHQRNGGFINADYHKQWGAALDKQIAHMETTLARDKQFPHMLAPIAQSQAALDTLHGERDAYREHGRVKPSAAEKRAQTIAAKKAAPAPAVKQPFESRVAQAIDATHQSQKMWGEKTFISSVRDKFPDMSDHDFRAKLVEAHKAGHVELSRGDLQGAIRGAGFGGHYDRSATAHDLGDTSDAIKRGASVYHFVKAGAAPAQAKRKST